jgi:hypothetical protein
LVGNLKATEEKSRIRIRSSVYRSQETDPYLRYQNVTGPEPWISGYLGAAEKPSLPPPDVSIMVGSTSDLPTKQRTKAKKFTVTTGTETRYKVLFVNSWFRIAQVCRSGGYIKLSF